MTKEKAGRSLSANHHKVLDMFDNPSMTYLEAAQTLGIKLGTLRSRLSRARSIVREHEQRARAAYSKAVGR